MDDAVRIGGSGDKGALKSGQCSGRGIGGLQISVWRADPQMQNGKTKRRILKNKNRHEKHYRAKTKELPGDPGVKIHSAKSDGVVCSRPGRYSLEKL